MVPPPGLGAGAILTCWDVGDQAVMSQGFWSLCLPVVCGILVLLARWAAISRGRQEGPGGGLGSWSSMIHLRQHILEEHQEPCANKVAGPGDAGGCWHHSPHMCCQELWHFLKAQEASKGLLTTGSSLVSGCGGMSLRDWCRSREAGTGQSKRAQLPSCSALTASAAAVSAGEREHTPLRYAVGM